MITMKRMLFYLLLCVCPSLLSAQNMNLERHWKKNVEKVRVMSYNIFNGFDWGNDTEREERFVAWVKEQDPEILGLQELCGFTQEKLAELAAKWGHRYAVIVKEDGYPVGITSKKPIEVKAKLVGQIGHGLLHVKTYGFDVLVTHLNPSNTVKRNREAEQIVAYIKEHKLDNCMLMGDMNSHSPMDADYNDLVAVALTDKYGGAASANLLDGKIDYSVISHFLAAPLFDICRMYVPADKRETFPTPVLMGCSKHKAVRKRASERLDYIFVSRNLVKKAVDAFIFNEGPTEYLSDHFPVAVDFCVDVPSQK